jgi:pyruvate dehydrogenase E2 component (dihydrolipoamide acetyltransferase)
MATFEFKLPDIGEGVVEGEIVKWLVKAGDSVKEDQPLLEVMTDKATVVIPSPKAGRVTRTHGKEGEVARVHHPLVDMELDGTRAGVSAPDARRAGERPAPSPDLGPRRSAPTADFGPRRSASTTNLGPRSAAATQVGSGSPATATRPAAKTLPGEVDEGHRALATPVTRRIAREHQLDLRQISGTGPQGRVLKADVEAVLNSGDRAALPPVEARGSPALVASRGDQRVPLRGLRKKIAEKMVRSKFTAPHYAFVEEVDATELVAIRAKMNESLAAEGLKVSFLPFFVKALVAAFRKFPQVNANMDEAAQELVVRGEFNIGIAAMTEQGLTVPVVRGADRHSLRSLGVEIARLGDAARGQKLKLDEVSGGTFTISSLGQTGGLFATPIINHPEVAIMGVHRMRQRPVVNARNEIVVRPIMLFSFCFDHRVIDGATGAEFAYEVIKYVERPELLLVDAV